MPVCHNLKLCFIHIPKTAGSSVEKMLGWSGEKHLIGKINPKYNVCPQHLYWQELQQEVPEVVDYIKFSIVRNPYDRLVSEYHYAKQMKCRPHHFVKNLNFESFVDEILKMPESDRQYIFDRHLEPQSNFLEGCENIKLFQFENLQECFFFLRQINPLIADKHENKSKRENWQKYYSEEAKTKVCEFYKVDFEKFGYAE